MGRWTGSVRSRRATSRSVASSVYTRTLRRVSAQGSTHVLHRDVEVARFLKKKISLNGSKRAEIKSFRVPNTPKACLHRYFSNLETIAVVV